MMQVRTYYELLGKWLRVMIEKVLMQHVENEIDRTRIEFGLEVIRNEIPKVVLLILIFAVWGRLAELWTLLFFLLPIRAEAGGLHVRTLAGCVGVTLLYCVMIVSVARYDVSVVLQIGFLAAAGVLYWCFAPALSRKRQAQITYDESHQRRMVVLILCLDIIVIMVMIRTAPGQYANIGVWTLLIQSLQLPLIRFGRRKKND